MNKLLKTDEDFSCEGKQGSVGAKMFEMRAHEKLEELMQMGDEDFFEAAQDCYAYYQYLTDTLEDQNDENMAEGLD